MYDIDLIIQGHKIKTRDGRKLIFENVSEGRVWCREPHEENASAWIYETGFWRRDGIESCADIVLDQNKEFQLSLF